MDESFDGGAPAFAAVAAKRFAKEAAKVAANQGKLFVKNQRQALENAAKNIDMNKLINQGQQFAKTQGQTLINNARAAVTDLKTQATGFMKNSMNNMQSSLAGVTNTATDGANTATDGANTATDGANTATGIEKSAQSNVDSITASYSIKGIMSNVYGQHPIIYILAFNFVLRAILLVSFRIKPKAKDKIHLEHSKSALGISLASLCIAGYIHYVNMTANKQSKYNEQLSVLLFILLYVVILYDLLIPLFQKHKGKGKVAKQGSLAGLILLPGFLLFLMLFVSKEIDAKMKLDVKILNNNSMLMIFFTLAASVFISIVSFITLYTEEIANKKTSEEQVKLMKSYYIMLMIAVFILALVIEYTLSK